MAELIENEQQQTQNQPSKVLDNSTQRCRLPPPGFSHMNAFGLGVPRAPTQTSKILPFMSSSGNTSQSQQSHNWPHHSGQPQQSLNYGIHDQMNSLLPKQGLGANKSSKCIKVSCNFGFSPYRNIEYNFFHDFLAVARCNVVICFVFNMYRLR